jgi:protease I
VAKVLMITGDAGEALEVMYPLQRLKEEGIEVHLAAPEKRPIQTVVHDFVEGFDTYTEKPGYRVPVDVALKDVRPEEYVALVIPGGRAPEYLRNDPDARRIVQHFYGANKPVAQLCHGPLIPAAAGLLKGHRTAAYNALEPDITMAGATFVDGEAVVDGQIISGRAWPDHPAYMREFMKVLRQAIEKEGRQPAASAMAG